MFINEITRIAWLEKGRAFCGHDTDHLLDVARIAHAMSLEENTQADKEHIYAAALLHDIGRAKQYDDGTPHEAESARIAARVLPDCGFDDIETDVIVDAILEHRTGSRSERAGVAKFLFRADKLSRRCFDCAARDECDWEMKNQMLEY